MGINPPLNAWLTDAMALPGRGTGQAGRYPPPGRARDRVRTRRAAAGPGGDRSAAMSATASVLGGAEIIDSRFRDFKFTLPDVVADNASSGGYVTGPVALPPGGLDLAMEAVLLERDGAVVASAAGAAVLGHPAAALAWPPAPWAAGGGRLARGLVVIAGGTSPRRRPLAPGTSRRVCTSPISARFSCPAADEPAVWRLTCRSLRSPWPNAATLPRDSLRSAVSSRVSS